jgi:hypothetical protein
MCSAVLELRRVNRQTDRQTAIGRTLEIFLSKALKITINTEEISLAENSVMIFVSYVPCQLLVRQLDKEESDG